MRHIEEIEARIGRFDPRLLAKLESKRNTLALLQTLPGVDLIGAAMLLVETVSDMDAFGSADILIHSAGNVRRGLLTEISYEDFESVLSVHLRVSRLPST